MSELDVGVRVAPRQLDVSISAELWTVPNFALRTVLREHVTTGGRCRACGPVPEVPIIEGGCRFRIAAEEALRRRHELWIGGVESPPRPRRTPVDPIGGDQRPPRSASYPPHTEAHLM